MKINRKPCSTHHLLKDYPDNISWAASNGDAAGSCLVVAVAASDAARWRLDLRSRPGRAAALGLLSSLAPPPRRLSSHRALRVILRRQAVVGLAAD